MTETEDEEIEREARELAEQFTDPEALVVPCLDPDADISRPAPGKPVHGEEGPAAPTEAGTPQSLPGSLPCP